MEEIVEICEHLNICSSTKMFQAYSELSKYNQKTSKNLLHLAAIFYVSNMDFYLSINRLAKVWDQNIQNNYVNVSLLNRYISKALMTAKLNPPLENFSFVIDYTLKHLCLPPKYLPELKQIMEIISNELKIFKKRCIKTPNLMCLAVYFFKTTTHFCKENSEIFNILYVPWKTFERNKNYVLSFYELSPHIHYIINKLEINFGD